MFEKHWKRQVNDPENFSGWAELVLSQIAIQDRRAATFKHLSTGPQVHKKQDIADRYVQAVRSLGLAKAELLGKTHVMEFINQRCAKLDPKFALEEEFKLRDDGTFNSKFSYYEYPKKLMELLEAIGIPKDHIERAVSNETTINKKSGEKEITWLHYVRVNIDEAVINGLIEKAVEERVEQIMDEFRAYTQNPEKLRGLISRYTGIQLDAEDPKKPMEMPSLDDLGKLEILVRRQAGKEVLGTPPAQSTEKDGPSL